MIRYCIKKTQAFNFETPPHDPEELVAAMNALMEEKNGLGLSAPQVGIPFSMFVMRGPLAIFNPTIVTLSNELIRLDEGCLSYPGIALSIERPRHVRVHTRRQGRDTYRDMGEHDGPLFSPMRWIILTGLCSLRRFRNLDWTWRFARRGNIHSGKV